MLSTNESSDHSQIVLDLPLNHIPTAYENNLSDNALSIFDATPPIDNLDTPNISLDPSDQEISFSSEADQDGDQEAADRILQQIRVKNVNKIIIGTLNINSLAPKFELLKEIIGKNLDIITIQETKLDASYPAGQFLIDGYSQPYRLDRNRNGGGVDDLCT